MFLRMTNTTTLVKYFSHIKKDFKIQDDRQFWPKRSRYEINKCASLNIALIMTKQKVLKSYVYL